MENFAKSARIALGVTVLGALALGGWGCGSSNHANSNPDAKDGKTGSAGSDAMGTAGSGGATAGNDGGAGAGGAAGTGTAGNDGGAGAGGAAGTGTAGNDGGAGAGGAAGTGTAGNDGGAAGSDATGAAGNDGGAAGSDATGAAGADAAAGADGAAGSDGGVSDASDAGDASDASDASDAADVPCTNACTLGAKQCGSGGIQTCVAGSSTCTVWSAPASCGLHSSCSVTGGVAACGCNATSCTATGKFCSSTTERTNCDVDTDGCFFATAAPVACGQRQTCTGVAGSATCTCSTDPSCASGTDTFCASGSSQSNCGTDTDGCFFVASTNACPVHEVCTGNKPTGKCGCSTPPVECMNAANTTFCATSTSVSTCKQDGNSCIFADTAVGCGTHQACTTPTAGASVCSCNVDATCGSTVGNICVNGNTQSVNCAKDADLCIFNTGTTSCGTHQTCGGASNTCQCNTTVCTATGPFCDAGNVSTCSKDVNNCLFVSAANSTTCTANATCTGGAGSASCVCNPTGFAGCTGGGNFCKSSSVQAVCTTDGTCPAVDPAGDTTCPIHQSCKGAGLGGACSCDSTCTAAQAGAGGNGTYCLDALHQQSCTNDSNLCHIANSPVTCVGIQTCQGPDGVGACQCPGAGLVAGTGCTTLGSTVCQGNTVLTCITDVPSGCQFWAQPNDCTASGLVCGTKSTNNVAACQCADHAGTDYFVDPVAGSDAQTFHFPTGIDSPAECRFGTLGKALSLATTAGDRVVATTAAPPHPFAAETFPLTVSPGVTLTTSDAVLTPGNYTIDFPNGAGASAISLGDSSVVEGFTISNDTGGNGAASAISITGTGATVDTVVVEGAGPLGSGIKVTGSGLINAATVQGALTGVSIASASTVTLQNSTIDTNGTGVSLASGALTASSVIVKNSSGHGIVVSGATASLSGTSLTVSNNAGAGILQSGGSATLTLTSGEITANSVGGISLSAGTATLGAVNVHANAGAGIVQSGGAITLGSGGTTTVASNTGTGVTLSGGTLTVGAASIDHNTSDGVGASGIATLISNTGASYTSNGGNGINATSSTLTFNGAAATPIVVSNNTGDGILMTAGGLTANYLTLGANGTGTTKKSGLEIAGVAAVGLGTSLDAALSFTGNGLNGVTINGTTAGSKVDMHRAQITGNTGDGVSINLNGGTGASAAIATLTTVTTSNNGGHGVEVLNAPLGSSTACTIDGLTADSNTSSGVYLRGNLGNVVATVKNSKLTSNTKFGILVEQGIANTTQENIQSNEITLNTAGGIAFNTSSTLNAFSANTIHHNGGDQILVAARQNGLTAWNFASNNACDVNRNQVWCYAGAGGSGFNPAGVGIRVTGVPAASVTADFMSWAEAVPAANTDYITSGTLTKTGPCAAQTACP